VTGVPADLATFRRRLAALSDGPAEELVPDELIQDLETAYEELRAADEEIRSQQEHIAALLGDQDAMQERHERMLATLPVPALVTNRHGAIRTANTAAAAFFHLRPGRMIGKPAFSLVASDDRRTLRVLLSQALAEQGPVHTLATVEPRESEAVAVQVTLTATRTDLVTWVLLSAGVDAAPAVRALPQALTELSTLGARSPDLQTALGHAAQTVAATLGEGAAVSVSVGEPLQPRQVASSCTVAQHLDGAQITAGEGPCQTAFETRMLVESADLRADDRWPALSRLVVEPQGAIAIPLGLGDEPSGCLNVYCTTEQLESGLTQASELFAASIAAVIHEFEYRQELSTLADGLRKAMESRATIEQAKGMLMLAHGWDAEQAFAHLVQLSSTRNQKLRHVAAQIVSRAPDS
jgi:PAS domain S-box-containing protein